MNDFEEFKEKKIKDIKHDIEYHARKLEQAQRELMVYTEGL